MFSQPSYSAKMRFAVLCAAALALAACSTTDLPDAPKSIGPTANAHYKIGAPYKIDGRWYVPKVDVKYDETGIASWYGDAFHNKLTANGEIFDKRRISAAHKTLPLPTLVEVENLENGRRVVVRVNDRGPFVDDRIIDLSHAAADELGFTAKGLARVRVRYLGETDVKKLAALPGDTETRPQKFAAKTAAPSVLAAASVDDDPIATLISNSAPAFAALQKEFWVEIARIDDLDALERMRLDLPELGPVVIQTDHADGRIMQSLRIGPFIDEAIAIASLSKAKAAGFGSARMIRSEGI